MTMIKFGLKGILIVLAWWALYEMSLTIIDAMVQAQENQRAVTHRVIGGD